MEDPTSDLLDHPNGSDRPQPTETLPTEEHDSVLANSIRRVTDATRRPPLDIIATFNNFA